MFEGTIGTAPPFTWTHEKGEARTSGRASSKQHLFLLPVRTGSSPPPPSPRYHLYAAVQLPPIGRGVGRHRHQRPVISNDGWEHTSSDLLTIHDYTWSRDVLVARYADGIEALLRTATAGPRVLVVGDAQATDVPVMLTEVGGVRFVPESGADTWGYSTATSTDDYAERIAAILEPLRASPRVAGFCWTQLTDTLQEANGLCTADRVPKLPVERLRRLVTGE